MLPRYRPWTVGDPPDPDDLDWWETNPCENPDYVPNYRKMRFGLATALLHNGGNGMHYLGSAAASAVCLISDLTTSVLSGIGDFESGMGSWSFWSDGYGDAFGTIDTTSAAEGSACFRADINGPCEEDWYASLSAPVSIEAGLEPRL